MITYPTDPADTFTVYSTTLSAPVQDGKGRERRGIPWLKMSVDDSQMIDGLDSDTFILQDVKDARPVADTDYDPATHKPQRTDTVYDVGDESATDGWEIIALTQAEIDANARQADIDAQQATMKAAHAKLIAGTATAAQVQTVVAFLLKQQGLDL